MSEITAELPADGRPMEGRSVADSSPIRPRSHSRLGRLKLKTVADLDGRTRAARRARAVVAELVKALGGPDAVSPGQRQACERAGMLTAIAEDLAARQLAGLPVTLDEVLRAEGVARRSVQAILANRPEPKPTERPGLAIARQRWAEQEAAAAKKQQENDQILPEPAPRVWRCSISLAVEHLVGFLKEAPPAEPEPAQHSFYLLDLLQEGRTRSQDQEKRKPSKCPP